MRTALGYADRRYCASYSMDRRKISQRFDTVVLGMGPGGEVAGSRLIAGGKRVAVVATHLRGFVAYLVFGLGVAATAESLRWLGHNGTSRGTQ